MIHMQRKYMERHMMNRTTVSGKWSGSTDYSLQQADLVEPNGRENAIVIYYTLKKE